ncbi:uncharacterized protein LOC111706507 [Eurytemora carolleeae]|uniref:uncharacterized protein LOC111706507 n=1 Tax=Eurytemora carolleeae TaxID=1294199 RepID=UPI000C75FD40|nr:uncharacterized protein LOC111706507 [Eurytemora carolleeae]|eukprot:XP_023335166.1 uncharacterized protein LOC111706507 [Eurytemora affinis]
MPQPVMYRNIPDINGEKDDWNKWDPEKGYSTKPKFQKISQGLLHGPITQPDMLNYGFGLAGGTENFYSLTPKVIHADPAVRETNPQTKNCYLQEEKYLKFYSFYSLNNYLMECQGSCKIKGTLNVNGTQLKKGFTIPDGSLVL